MKSKLSIVKIGGHVIDDDRLLDSFLKDFAQLKSTKMLVHGGGKLATRLSRRLGISVEMENGRRITSSENLEVVTMVYAGLVNKRICAALQGYGCSAMGVSGVDANSILSEKRKVGTVDYGWVGDVKAVDADLIRGFLSSGITPVFCPISHDGKGHLLNINADTVAAELAIAMSRYFETELIYCFEKNGVLSDVENSDSVIEVISPQTYHELKASGKIASGMLPKMANCFNALERNVSGVTIGSPAIIGNKHAVCTTITL